MMRNCPNYYYCYNCRIGEEWLHGLMMGLLRLVIVAMTVILERKILGRLQLRTGPIVVRW